jgi:hypothetical protein
MSILKSRWLKIDTEYNKRKIFEIISTNTYTQESLAGFIDINHFENYIEATFVEQVTITQHIVDPFGNETEQQINSYNHVVFRVIGKDFIEVISPPRSIKSFTQFLTKIFKHELFISALKIDLRTVLNNASSAVDSMMVKKAKVSGLKIGEKGLASVEIKSVSDALEDLYDFSRGSNYILDKVCGVITMDSEKFEFEISKLGYLSCHEDLHHLMVDILVTNKYLA